MIYAHGTIRTCLLVVSIGRGDGLRDILLLEDEREPVQVRFIGVGDLQRVRNERRATTSGPESTGGGECETKRELGVCDE